MTTYTFQIDPPCIYRRLEGLILLVTEADNGEVFVTVPFELIPDELIELQQKAQGLFYLPKPLYPPIKVN